MRSHLQKVTIVAALCFGLIAAAKVIRVEVFIADPDDNYAYVADIEVSVTAYDSHGNTLAVETPQAQPAGPNAHVRLTLPAETARMTIDVYDVDDHCGQTFGPVDVGGRAHVGGQGFFFSLDDCRSPAMPRR